MHTTNQFSVHRRVAWATLTALMTLMLGLAACSTDSDRTAKASRPVEEESSVDHAQREAADMPEIDAVVVAPGTASQGQVGRLADVAALEQAGASPRARQRAPEALAYSIAPTQAMVDVPAVDVMPVVNEPLVDRENYETLANNPVRLAAEHPVSTFSIDVDTASYANMRRFINAGRLPPSDAVRVEELVNYFSYGYDGPDGLDPPFGVTTEVAEAPWNEEALLLQVGIKGFDVPDADRPAANLVFLVDVSGSMRSPDKLPLLKNAFRLLVGQLDQDDRVAMVVYAGASGLVLESTPGSERAKILSALDNLQAGGSTNGGDGIRLAYSVAADNFIDDGINRVVLATDGDFNVGTVNHEALVDLVERNRDGGIALTTLGFGQGNYNDHLLEQLADHGNGNAAYVDSLNEARKVLVEELSSTLQVIARDVKIQVEFNPAVVAEYRLIGYENRMLRREDFNNDRIDAGEIGAGHTVTALYELKLVGSKGRLVDDLRYGGARQTGRGDRDELAFLRLRYKAPDGDTSRLIETPVRRRDVQDLDETSDDFRFAAAVAAFGQSMRGGAYLGGFELDDVEALAEGARGRDPHGYRREFVSLVALAETLQPDARAAAR